MDGIFNLVGSAALLLAVLLGIVGTVKGFRHNLAMSGKREP